MNYYYAKGDEVVGPKSLEDLAELCRTGEIPVDVQVCTEEAGTWQPLSALVPAEQLEPYETPQPPNAPPIPIASELPLLPQAREQGYEYKVVPFVAVIAHTQGATSAASQLQDLIQGFSEHGWEYVRLESVETFVAGDNGCFGFGATPPRTTVYSMAVFRK